jgi:Zn finger protein HypA/HybF involved in hydrogenase expression
MAITSERLKQTFSEGGAQEIYQEIKAASKREQSDACISSAELEQARTEFKAEGVFLGFAQRYVFDSDYRVARSALWGLTKATNKELSELQAILNELIDQAMHTDNSSVRRLSLNIIERLKMNKEDLRTDFLDFCFEHMVGIEEYSGIQTLCMKLAYRMCTFYPELMDELKRTLEAMEIDYYKPAIKCLRKRILGGRYK